MLNKNYLDVFKITAEDIARAKSNMQAFEEVYYKLLEELTEGQPKSEIAEQYLQICYTLLYDPVFHYFLFIAIITGRFDFDSYKDTLEALSGIKSRREAC